MINILYWNLRKNAIEDYIIECIAENDIDIAIFSEYEKIDFKSIENKLGKMYMRISGVQADKKVSLLAKKTLNVTVVQQQHRYTLYSVKTGVNDYILTAVHLEDRRNFATADRNATIQRLVGDIERTEALLCCGNTIVIGDFNANPYDEELISKYTFNAVLFKSVIEKGEFTNPNTIKRKRFYNPILHYISEDTGMYGSFYYDQGHMTSYWHCLDQMLVRKSLINSVTDIKYLKKINSRELIGEMGPNKEISDHLPLVVCLQEV